MKITINKKCFLIYICVFFTICSQMPLFREKMGIDTQSISVPLWLGVLLVSVFREKKSPLKKLIIPSIYIFCFLILIMFFQVITNNNYLNSVMVTPILISIIMIFIGYLNCELLDEENFKVLSRAYIFSTLLLCLDIYFSYLKNYDFNTINYVFRAKNSAGQIIVTSIILLLYYPKKEKKIIKLISFCIMLVQLYVLILIRSRASIVSLLFIPLFTLVRKNERKKYKLLLTVIILLFIVSLFLFDDLYNLVVKNLLLNINSNRKLTSIDINSISSYRFDYLEVFPNLLKNNYLVGIGNYYMDNFYLAALLNYGIIGGTMTILFSLYPSYKVFNSNYLDDDKLIYIIKLIIVVYTFNSFFECLAPFGPGTKCFFMWLIFGAYLRKRRSV